MVLQETMKNPFSIRCSGKAQMLKCGCFSKSFYSDRCHLFLDSENASVHLLSNPASEPTGAKEPTDVRTPAGEGKERAPVERLPVPPSCAVGGVLAEIGIQKSVTASCSGL